LQGIKVIAGHLVEAGIDGDDADTTAHWLAQVMQMDPKKQQKIMLARAFALATDGDKGRDTIKALAAAVGYKDGWVKWAWDYVQKKSRVRA